MDNLVKQLQKTLEVLREAFLATGDMSLLKRIESIQIALAKANSPSSQDETF